MLDPNLRYGLREPEVASLRRMPRRIGPVDVATGEAVAGERGGPVYPFAVMIGSILTILGAIEIVWFLHAAGGVWLLPEAEVAASQCQATLALLQRAGTALAMPAGIWLLMAPGSGRLAVTALMGVAGWLIAFGVPTMTGNGAAAVVLMGTALVALWVERLLVHRAEAEENRLAKLRRAVLGAEKTVYETDGHM